MPIWHWNWHAGRPAVEKEAGPFNRIARETITNPHLSLKAKGLLTLILGFPEEWDFSIAGLRPFLLEGRESIMSALRELEEKGHVSKTIRRSDDGRFCKYDYAFYDLPLTGLPISANPLPVCPQMADPAKDTTEHWGMRYYKVCNDPIQNGEGLISRREVAFADVVYMFGKNKESKQMMKAYICFFSSS